LLPPEDAFRRAGLLKVGLDEVVGCVPQGRDVYLGGGSKGLSARCRGQGPVPRRPDNVGVGADSRAGNLERCMTALGTYSTVTDLARFRG